jgi:hypothetical protein
MLRSEKTEDEKNLIVPLTLLDCFQQCYADEEDYSDLLTLRIDHFAPVHFLSGTGIAIVEIKCLAKDGWEDRWVKSEWKKEDNTVGEWNHTAGKWNGDTNNKGEDRCTHHAADFVFSFLFRHVRSYSASLCRYPDIRGLQILRHFGRVP